MFSQYKLNSGLILTVNELWINKLLFIEKELKKSVIGELISERNAKPFPKTIPSSITDNKNIFVVEFDGRVEKRYWVLTLVNHNFFIKEERNKKNYLIKSTELTDSLRQSKYVNVPTYILKVEDPKRHIRITVAEQIKANSIKTPATEPKKIKGIQKVVNKLSAMDLLPAILRPSHFLFVKSKIYLVDNAIGFPPINRNKVILLNFIENGKINLDWAITGDMTKFGTFYKNLKKPIRTMINNLRIKNLMNEVKNGEKLSTDFEKEVIKKAAILFPKYKKKHSSKTKYRKIIIKIKLQELLIKNNKS